jgi:hypothetical protein
MQSSAAIMSGWILQMQKSSSALLLLTALAMSRVVSAWAMPLGVKQEKLLLPWMRPSAFHVL